MSYLLSFLEGIITFISPCMLPMLPVYLSYFAGEDTRDLKEHKNKTLKNSLGFISGFTIIFLLLGTASATLGNFIKDYTGYFNLLGGLLLILFGLNFLNIISIPLLNQTKRLNIKLPSLNFFSSLLFGFIFAISWTPCIGPFLGSALLLSASSQDASAGMIMLLLFSLGLGIPFLLSALLLDSLKHTFNIIKNHYRIINLISGLLLVGVGILMMSGHLNTFLSLLTFN